MFAGAGESRRSAEVIHLPTQARCYTYGCLGASLQALRSDCSLNQAQTARPRAWMARRNNYEFCGLLEI